MGLTENIPFSLLHIHHIVTLMMRCRLALCRCRYWHYCRCSAPTSRSEHWFKTTFYVYKNSVSPLSPRASSGHPPPARPVIPNNSHQQHPMGALSLGVSHTVFLLLCSAPHHHYQGANFINNTRWLADWLAPTIGGVPSSPLFLGDSRHPER